MTDLITKYQIHPNLGEGVYLSRDIAKILNLKPSLVRRWIVGYWSGDLDNRYSYTFGDGAEKAINFLSLIEFYTFFKLRESGISVDTLRKFHLKLSQQYNTPYPFATSRNYFTEKKNAKTFLYYDHLDTLIRFDDKHQFKLDFFKEFLDQVEFDDNNLAIRFYPLKNSKNIVVDPKHQLGQPTITGTNLKTQTIYNMSKAGEPIENISLLYNVSINEINDAIAYHKMAC
ncbi:MAG: DUF433 domain-containing protein [Flavobacteriales bacterium]|jgi:uncharacterized protein (DUF433 family)